MAAELVDPNGMFMAGNLVRPAMVTARATEPPTMKTTMHASSEVPILPGVEGSPKKAREY